MDVVLKIKGVKEDEIERVEYKEGLIVLSAGNKQYKFTIQKKMGSYLIVQDEVKIVSYECQKAP